MVNRQGTNINHWSKKLRHQTILIILYYSYNEPLKIEIDTYTDIKF